MLLVQKTLYAIKAALDSFPAGFNTPAAAQLIIPIPDYFGQGFNFKRLQPGEAGYSRPFS